MIDVIEIGKRIGSARKDLNLTQEELAKELGLNKSTIQRYETGQVQRIKIPVLAAMAKILNVSPEWLSNKVDFCHILTKLYKILLIMCELFYLIKNITVTNDKISRGDYSTSIIGDVTNTSNKTVSGVSVNITLYKDNNEVDTTHEYIGDMSPNSTRKMEATTYSVDFDSYTIDYVTGIIYD